MLMTLARCSSDMCARRTAMVASKVLRAAVSMVLVPFAASVSRGLVQAPSLTFV